LAIQSAWARASRSPSALAHRLIDKHRARIALLLHDAQILLTGSALIEGLSAEDVDLVVLVPNVRKAAAQLRVAYPPLYEDQWRDDWAAFRDPGPPQVDLVVTRPGAKGDAHHRRVWEYLADRPELLAEYRAFKMNRTDYERRKAAFFEGVVRMMEGNR
jgi:GrpB-like predicted nucleotidyltransferase (UPF0157 family)